MVPMAFFSMNFMFKKMGKSSIIVCLQLWSFESMKYESIYFVWGTLLFELTMYFHILFLTFIDSQIIQARKIEDVELGCSVLHGQNGHPYLLPASKQEKLCLNSFQLK